MIIVSIDAQMASLKNFKFDKNLKFAQDFEACFSKFGLPDQEPLNAKHLS